MPSSADCWGIEVGANAIKAIKLQRSGSDVKVVQFEVLPFKRVLTTPEIDADEAICLGLDQFASRHKLSKSTVVVSVPGHMAFARFAKLPPVEPKKIPDIVKFEAVQQIPFPIDQVEWDFQTFQSSDSPDVEVGIFAITKDRVLPWLANFQRVGIPVNAVTLSPISIYNALSYDMDMVATDTGTIIMDIGTQATDLIITDGRRVWTRTIPLGGNQFTESLVRGFRLSFSKAEKLKREAPTSKYARQIFQTMRPVFVDMVQEVQKSLGYYQSLHRDIELTRLIGLGSTWRLPGLQTFLKQQLQLEVQRLDSFKKIEVEGRNAATFANNTLSLAPAYGLALQGLGIEKVACNLLPAPIVRQQIWGQKKKSFIAAAAVMALAGIIAFFGAMFPKSAYDSAQNQTKRNFVQQITRQATDLSKKFSQIRQQADPTPQIKELQKLSLYRTLWSDILQDIDQAIMSLKPQEQLLSGKINQIKNIPRSQRNQVDIIEIIAVYDPGFAANQSSLRSNEDSDQTWETNPPSYRISLTGTTPHGYAEVFISSFVKWLKNNSDQPGRAYRTANQALVSIEPVKIENGRISNQPASQINTSTIGRPNLPGRWASENTATKTSKATDKIELADILPPGPFADENRSGDSQFTIQWRVVLQKPEDVFKEQYPLAKNDDSVAGMEQ